MNEKQLLTYIEKVLFLNSKTHDNKSNLNEINIERYRDKNLENDDSTYVNLILDIMGRKDESLISSIDLKPSGDYVFSPSMIDPKHYFNNMSPAKKYSILKPFFIKYELIDAQFETTEYFYNIYDFYNYTKKSVDTGENNMLHFLNALKELTDVKLMVINDILETNFTPRNFEIDDDQNTFLMLNAI